jgi:hypothetical protein
MAAAMIILVVVLSMLCMACGSAIEPQPPLWPQQFTATLLQNLNGSLAELTLAYDWPGGRNLNLIASEQGNVLWSVEWNNGSTYYFDKQVKLPSIVADTSLRKLMKLDLLNLGMQADPPDTHVSWRRCWGMRHALRQSPLGGIPS